MESYPSRLSFHYFAPARQTFLSAVYDDIDPEQLRAVLSEAFAGACALRLTFVQLDYFDTERLFFWAVSPLTRPE